MYTPKVKIVITLRKAAQTGAKRPRYVQRVIWTPRTLFFDSLDTQRFMSGFAEEDFTMRIKDAEDVVSLL